MSDEVHPVLLALFAAFVFACMATVILLTGHVIEQEQDMERQQQAKCQPGDIWIKGKGFEGLCVKGYRP